MGTRFEIHVEDESGKVIEVCDGGTYDDFMDLRTKYNDEPEYVVLIARQWEEEDDE